MTRRISNPYERIAHKTEWTNAQKMTEWINEITRETSLPLGIAEMDTRGADRKRPDVIIKERPGSENIILLLELKNPAFDVFYDMESARQKATRRRAPYFATSNFRELIWFNTKRANDLEPLEKQIVQRYTLSDIIDPDTIEEPGIKGAIRRGLERLLKDLVEVATGKTGEPKHAIDEILVYRLQNAIKTLAIHYKRTIEDKAKADRRFSKQLQKWFIEQGWSFSFQDQDYAKAARQTAYLLVNKILFYSVIQAIRRLDPLDIPKSLTRGDLLQNNLQGFFKEVLKIDYETIYSTDFIDQVAFPDSQDVVEEIKELIEVLGRYDFSKLGYEVIGRIFEKLIPNEERHILGQYFTNADVVDLILRFCLKHESDKVLDPACGAGTFLVRSYQHKKLMNQRLTHEEVLKTIWGNDIAKFPAHLTTINLAINDLRSDENYPRVIQKDFFDLFPDRVEFALPEAWRRVQIKGLGRVEKSLEHPRFFDCVVGNPPYTRQEEIEEIQEKKEGYKEHIIRKATTNIDGKKFADISRRAGIYAYFFIHGTKFLQNGGRFGFVVSNSWLDVDYGKGLQEHFLTNYKIIAIVESKVERWFEDADINTCIVVLEKASGDRLKREREEQLVRFTYLKKPLRYFIPPAENMWEKEVGRLDAIDRLIKTIPAHSSYYENDDLRIYPKSQKELWEEGYDPEERKYVGAKWGKYLRAPKIFFTILEKAKGKLVPLKQVVKVKRGFTTGADPWFYVRDITPEINRKDLKTMASQFGHKGSLDKIRAIRSGDGTSWLIEEEYLYPVTRNPDDYKDIFINVSEINDWVVLIRKPRNEIKGKLIERYVIHGERKLYDMGKKRKMIPAKTQTCEARDYWFQLPNAEPACLLWQKAIDRYHRHYLCDVPVLANQRFYLLYPENKRHERVIACLANSSLTSLYLEFQRAALGLGAIEATVEEVRQIPVIDPSMITPNLGGQFADVLEKLGRTPVKAIFEELTNPYRVQMDDLILRFLGFDNDEERKSVLMELYRELKDLAQMRLAKAKSVQKGNRTKEGVNLDLLAQTVLTSLGNNSLAAFFRSRVATMPCRTLALPKHAEPVEIENSLLGWRLKIGKQAVDCSSEAQARYLRVFAEMGWDHAPIPRDDSYLLSIIDQWEDLFEKAHSALEEHTLSILRRNIRDRLAHEVWAKIGEQMSYGEQKPGYKESD